MAPRPYATTVHGATLALKVMPKAKRNAIEGVASAADGGTVLKVAVTAAPEGGRANKAVIGLLAKEWRLAKSCFSVTRGVTNRRKTVAIAGDATALKAMLDDWFASRE